ncbi:MAG: DUF3048 domain-containing protein [Oscillospiraceae bacterium]|nr:DUF3048 domain-containing protein [Oscillospiraceae bacterium]
MKKILALMLALSMGIIFASCTPSQSGDNSSDSAYTEGEGSAQKKEYVLNHLTGEETLSKTAENKRPIGVMINNIKASLPQRGIAEADLYYEAVAEGGISRILALFSDVDEIPDIGSLRSARHYYLALAMGHNAIYCHFGGSPYSLNYIKNNGIPTVNFISTAASYRDPNRVGKYAYEHTAFTDGERLKKAIDRLSIETDAKIADAFKFGDNADILAGGNAATNITVPFSGSTKATYTYDAATGLYKKGQFGTDHIDSATGETLAVKNVFVLQTTIGSLANADKNGRLDFELSGGTGYYACDGKIVHITWKKGDYSDPIKYYTLDGNELTVAAGKSWISIISTNNTITYN